MRRLLLIPINDTKCIVSQAPETNPQQLVGHNVSAPTARTVRDRRRHGVLLSRERLNKNYLDCPIYDLSKRRVHLGVLDSRYKFARDFAPGGHHTPVIWEQLTAHNDLELYDTARDPEKIVNLAARPEARRDLILPLNAVTSALVAHEVGEDQGGEYPGTFEQYNTMTLS